MARTAQHPDPAPLETDDVKVVLVGTAGWAVALVVLAVLRLADVGDVRTWWIGMCGYGIALGLFGVRYCRRRHEAIARDAALGLPQRE
ncbi:MAG: hypothetical protein JWN08_468 [Frankiales bacterium]|nr:hypothetical protein [Frankiales bacterium]